MNKNTQCVLGVDGGATKTVAAIADLKGKILQKHKGGPSSPRNVGIKETALSIASVIAPLCKKNKGFRILSTVIALPSVEEEYKNKKKEIIKYLKQRKEISRIFQEKVEIVSDQIASFKSGTKENNGVLLIAGTGSVAHGWRDEKEAKAGGWGWLADEGSAFWIGQQAFQAALKGVDKRGEETIIGKLALKEFNKNKIDVFLKEIYLGNPTKTIPWFSLICDKASRKKDKTAYKIMVQAGKELALAAGAVIKSLNFQKEKFPIVFVGSVFKSRIVSDTAKKEIKKTAPGVYFVMPKDEPVAGAVKLALEKIRP